MSRALALFGLGLLFGGAAGFLAAASSGVTFDGHEHDQNLAGKHSSTKPKHGGHGAHGELLRLEKSELSPSLKIHVKKDRISGWNLNILVKNFSFSPENASGTHKDGEGHAHIYINGKKVARHYGDWFHIAKLSNGKNSVKVVLNSNDHRSLAVGDAPLEASAMVEVK